MRHHRTILLLLILCCVALIREAEQRVRQQVDALITVVGDQYALARQWDIVADSTDQNASPEVLTSMLDN